MIQGAVVRRPPQSRWSCPLGVDWNAFCRHVQVFSAICLRCQGDLAGWNGATLKDMFTWATHMETMMDLLTDNDVEQLDAYLANPLSFAATSSSNDCDPSVILQAGMKRKPLTSAPHHMVRLLVKNPHLPTYVPLLKTTLSLYLSLVDSEITQEEVIGILVRDLMYEISPCVFSTLAHEWIARYGGLVCESRRLNARTVYEAEVVYFMKPDSVQWFAMSRALAARLNPLSFAEATSLGETAVRACRKNARMMEVLMLSLLPRPLFLTTRKTPQNDHITDTKKVNHIMHHILGTMDDLDMRNQVDSFVLMQVAALDPTYRSCLPI